MFFCCLCNAFRRGVCSLFLQRVSLFLQCFVLFL
jgi:hypothetical protein